MAKNDTKSGQTKDEKTSKGDAVEPAAAANPDAPKTVKMEALRSGSYAGTTYHAGDAFDADEQHVDTLHLSGFAARVDRVEAGQKARSGEQQAADRASLYKGTNDPGPAKPLTTHDVPGADAAKPAKE